MMFKLNSLVPELSVSNFEKSLGFYTNMLGFVIEYERREDKFAMLSYQGSQLMIDEQNGVWDTGEKVYPFGRGINLQIATDDADGLYVKVQNSNYPIMVEMQESSYRAGDGIIRLKEFLVMDPDGYLLRFAERLVD